MFSHLIINFSCNITIRVNVILNIFGLSNEWLMNEVNFVS